MRRSRSALTAWPAFADLMTVLAVLSLAIAAGVASVDAPAEDRIRALEAELAAAQERNTRDGDRIYALEAQLAAARGSDPRGGDRIQALEADLTAARERNAALEAGIEEAERREVERRLGSVPCLGTRPGSRTAPVPLLRIVVDSGYHLTRLWPLGKDKDVAGIPRLAEAIAHGLMQEGDLLRYARGMHAYGSADDTYDGPCRFWIRTPKGRNNLADDVRAGAGYREPVLPALQLVRSEPDSQGDRVSATPPSVPVVPCLLAPAVPASYRHRSLALPRRRPHSTAASRS